MRKEVGELLANLEDWVFRKIAKQEELTLSCLQRKELNREEGRKKLREKYIIDDQDINYLKQKGGALEIFKMAAKKLGRLFYRNYETMPSAADPPPRVYLRTPKGTETEELINGISDVHVEFRWDACDFWGPPADGGQYIVFNHSKGKQILCSIARDKDGQMIGFRLNNHSKEETVPLDNRALAKRFPELIETAPTVRLSYRI